MNIGATINGLKLLHCEEPIEVGHVLLVESLGALAGKTFDYLNMFVVKCGGLVEVVVNSYGSHAVMANFSSLRSVKNVVRAATPASKIISPNVMVPFLSLKVFGWHGQSASLVVDSQALSLGALRQADIKSVMSYLQPKSPILPKLAVSQDCCLARGISPLGQKWGKPNAKPCHSMPNMHLRKQVITGFRASKDGPLVP